MLPLLGLAELVRQPPPQLGQRARLAVGAAQLVESELEERRAPARRSRRLSGLCTASAQPPSTAATDSSTGYPRV